MGERESRAARGAEAQKAILHDPCKIGHKNSADTVQVYSETLFIRVRYRSDVLLSHSASRPSKYRSCEEPEVRSHPRTVPSAEHTESSSP